MSVYDQAFPPKPKFTETSLPSLKGKVYIITGASSGVGFELAKILYSKDATVYLGARSSERAQQAKQSIKSSANKSDGALEPFVLDLADLKTIKPATQDFMRKESRLDVLFLNAGVMVPPEGSRTKDGYDLELGTNCLGHFLLMRLLEPALIETAKRPEALANSTRVVWVSSLMNMFTPQGGLRFDAQGDPVQLKGMENYKQSKAGVVFLAHEFAQRLGDRGIISVSLAPGLMRTELQRHTPFAQRLLMSVIFKSPKYGAYTELFAGLSHEISMEDNGSFFIPWGRKTRFPDTLTESIKQPATGGPSISKQFYDWCEREIAKFL